ncbi:hypothetical protein J4714_13260 [Staphylococcus epidermidis]|nr:hypothetical protein [Staphylococcus epidermidis]
MLSELKELLEKRGFAEGNTTTPGDFVIERAFVEKVRQLVFKKACICRPFCV